MAFSIPEPLIREHEELHEELVRATQVPGKVGEAARAVASLLHPHFVKEEQFALPPLGLLPALAGGEVTPRMREVLAMTDRLEAELRQMCAEHRAIVGALQTLSEAAQNEGRSDVARFAAKLTLHARTEEEVLYPAAILIGHFLRLRLDTALGSRA